MKKALFCILAAALTAVAALAAPKATTLLSPNGKLTVNLETGSKQVSYTVIKDGKPVYEIRDIRLVTGTETIPEGNVKVGKTRFMYDKFQPVVPLKFSTVVDEYNETEISLGKGATMLLRVMDNAVAYRFVLDRKGDVEVYDDHFLLIPSDGFTTHYQTARSFNTSSEEPYRSGSLAEWAASDRKMATSPLLLSGTDDTQLLMGESDLDDYPHLFYTTGGPVYRQDVRQPRLPVALGGRDGFQGHPRTDPSLPAFPPERAGRHQLDPSRPVLLGMVERRRALWP